MGRGDRAVLYAAQRAYHSPRIDESQLVGVVSVKTCLTRRKPVTIAGREFSLYVSFSPRRILPERQGPPVRPLAHRLELVKRPEIWGYYFRNSPIEISSADYTVLERVIRSWKAQR